MRFSVSSAARYEVEITSQPKAFLEALDRKDRRRCDALCLIVLSLEKNPRPKDSRELQPGGKPAPGDMVLEYGGFWLAYRIDDDKKVVTVGIIRDL